MDGLAADKGVDFVAQGEDDCLPACRDLDVGGFCGACRRPSSERQSSRRCEVSAKSRKHAVATGRTVAFDDAASGRGQTSGAGCSRQVGSKVRRRSCVAPSKERPTGSWASASSSWRRVPSGASSPAALSQLETRSPTASCLQEQMVWRHLVRRSRVSVLWSIDDDHCPATCRSPTAGYRPGACRCSTAACCPEAGRCC